MTSSDLTRTLGEDLSKGLKFGLIGAAGIAVGIGLGFLADYTLPNPGYMLVALFLAFGAYFLGGYLYTLDRRVRRVGDKYSDEYRVPTPQEKKVGAIASILLRWGLSLTCIFAVALITAIALE